MHADCLPPCTVITLHRPWWRRLVDALAAATARADEGARASAWTAADLEALRDLPPQTLRDIGAPAWVQAHRHAAERAGLDLWRL